MTVFIPVFGNVPKISSNEFLRNLVGFEEFEVLVVAVMKGDMTACPHYFLLLLFWFPI
jgi:hypothetical protein